MIETERRDDAHFRQNDIGRIQPTAQANFDDSNIYVVLDRREEVVGVLSVDDLVLYTSGGELDGMVEAWTSTLSTREVLDLMDRHGVPAGLIYRPPDMLEDPHFKAREAIVSVPHPDFGELRMQNVAPKLSETPGSIRSPSPAMGQHNDEVYQGRLGLDDARYAALKAARVV